MLCVTTAGVDDVALFHSDHVLSVLVLTDGVEVGALFHSDHVFVLVSTAGVVDAQLVAVLV